MHALLSRDWLVFFFEYFFWCKLHFGDVSTWARVLGVCAKKKTIATHIKHNLAARELVLGSSLIWTEVDPSWDVNMLLGASGCMNLL